jgi:hypothetical protein
VAVWAPNARAVSVIGEWNGWEPTADVLRPRWDHSGIWEADVAALRHGQTYKFADHHEPRRAPGPRRPVRLRRGDRAGAGLTRMAPRLRVERRGVDGEPREA